MKWSLRVIFLLIGVGVAIIAYAYALPFNVANGVPPTQAAYIAFFLAAIVLSAWIGTLAVIIRLTHRS